MFTLRADDGRRRSARCRCGPLRSGLGGGTRGEGRGGGPATWGGGPLVRRLVREQRLDPLRRRAGRELLGRSVPRELGTAAEAELVVVLILLRAFRTGDH